MQAQRCALAGLSGILAQKRVGACRGCKATSTHKQGEKKKEKDRERMGGGKEWEEGKGKKEAYSCFSGQECVCQGREGVTRRDNAVFDECLLLCGQGQVW